MSKRKHNLIIVSHPDDETLFFAGLILSQRKRPWSVVCVTDGNADGQGALRAKQFENATKILGVKNTLFFNLPDEFNTRLDQLSLRTKLSELPTPQEVYTHGPLGEYGHPHHQDVCCAVHNFFAKKCPVYSVAHNCLPEKIVKLRTADFIKKSKILSEIYFSETERFINFVPATATECFAKIKLSEINAIYDYFSKNKNIDSKKLSKYKWFLPYFSAMNDKAKNRPF